MAVPLSYNLRNLLVRKTTTVMTALGIALTVAVMLGIFGMLAGIEQSFQSTGHPLNLLVMRRGAGAELSSMVTPEAFQVMRGKSGIQSDGGQLLASHEMVSVLYLRMRGSGEGANVNLRGLGAAGIRLRGDAVRLAQGRWFEPGRPEVVVGRGAAHTYENCQIGGQIEVDRGSLTVVGVFDGGQTAFNGEIWGDANQLASDTGRAGSLNSALFRAADAAALGTLARQIAEDQRLTHDALPEREYYERQTASGQQLRYLGVFVAIVMAVGSVFAAMNTMYAAVARRGREIGVLRVLGFSRASILLSFVIESLLLALVGGGLACLAVLPLNGLSNRIGNQMTFSQSLFEFRVTPEMLAGGLAFAAIMGVAGGLLPARMAARRDPLAALREL